MKYKKELEVLNKKMLYSNSQNIFYSYLKFKTNLIFLKLESITALDLKYFYSNFNILIYNIEHIMTPLNYLLIPFIYNIKYFIDTIIKLSLWYFYEILAFRPTFYLIFSNTIIKILYYHKNYQYHKSHCLNKTYIKYIKVHSIKHYICNNSIACIHIKC